MESDRQTHTDGFVGHWPEEVIEMLDAGTDEQFYELCGWIRLFTRCGCCPVKPNDVYEPISHEQARVGKRECGGSIELGKRSLLELLLEQHIEDAGLPIPLTSHKFALKATGRKWEADFAWKELGLLCEVEGGNVWASKSRHTTGIGFIRDCEKYAEAQILGWRVLRVPGTWVKDGTAIVYLERLMRMLQEQGAKR